MMKYTLIALAAATAFTSCKNPADSTTDAKVGDEAEVAVTSGGKTYVFSDESSIGFVGSKVTGSHGGEFGEFSGSFTLKEGEPKTGQFTIEMNSLTSDSEKLTSHLKNADFFDVEKHTQSKFAVTGFTKKSDSEYELAGNLTMVGVTKNITFPTQVAQNGDEVTVTAEFDINRQDFGINYAGKKDDLIRDEVIIKLNLKAKAE